MNPFFLALYGLFVVIVLSYLIISYAYSKIPFKESTVFVENTDGCILVPMYATKYLSGGRKGTDVSVDGIHAANIKPGDTVSVPIRSGMRKISVYWHEKEKFEFEILVDERTLIFLSFEQDGMFKRPSVKELKKDDHINESSLKKEYENDLFGTRLFKFEAIFRIFPIVLMFVILAILTYKS